MLLPFALIRFSCAVTYWHFRDQWAKPRPRPCTVHRLPVRRDPGGIILR